MIAAGGMGHSDGPNIGRVRPQPMTNSLAVMTCSNVNELRTWSMPELFQEIIRAYSAFAGTGRAHNAMG